MVASSQRTTEGPHTERYTEVNGRALFYVDAGRGQPVVLLHGWGADHSAWMPVVRDLAADHRVIAVDLRGHGRSDAAGNSYEFTELADDVFGLMRHLGLERAPLVAGHSMGGMVAQQLAVDHPESIAGMVILDADLNPEPLRTLMTLVGRVSVWGMWALASVLGESRSLALYPPLLAWVAYSRSWRLRHGADLRGEAGRFVRDNRAEDLAQSFLAYASRSDLRTGLAQTALPTLLVRGTRDRIMTQGKMEALQRTLPSSRLERIQGAGHMTIVEQPAVVAELIRAFAAEIEVVSA